MQGALLRHPCATVRSRLLRLARRLGVMSAAVGSAGSAAASPLQDAFRAVMQALTTTAEKKTHTASNSHSSTLRRDVSLHRQATCNFDRSVFHPVVEKNGTPSAFAAILAALCDQVPTARSIDSQTYQQTIQRRLRQASYADRLTVLPQILDTLTRIPERADVVLAFDWSATTALVSSSVWPMLMNIMFDDEIQSTMPVVAFTLAQLATVDFGFRLHLHSEHDPMVTLASETGEDGKLVDLHVLYEPTHHHFIPLRIRPPPPPPNNQVDVIRMEDVPAPEHQPERDVVSEEDSTAEVTPTYRQPGGSGADENCHGCNTGVHRFVDEFRAQTLTFETLALALKEKIPTTPARLHDAGFTDDGEPLILMFHQLAFLRWALAHELGFRRQDVDDCFRGCLADDVGMGKTLLILVLALLRPSFVPRPIGAVDEANFDAVHSIERINATLLIVPLKARGSSLIPEWMTQIRSFQRMVNGVVHRPVDDEVAPKNFGVAQLIPTESGMSLRHLPPGESHEEMLIAEELVRVDREQRQTTMKNRWKVHAKAVAELRTLRRRKKNPASEEELKEAQEEIDLCAQDIQEAVSEDAEHTAAEDAAVPKSHSPEFPRAPVALTRWQQLAPYTLIIINTADVLKWKRMIRRYHVKKMHAKSKLKQKQQAKKAQKDDAEEEKTSAEDSKSQPEEPKSHPEEAVDHDASVVSSDADSYDIPVDLHQLKCVTVQKEFMVTMRTARWLRIVFDEAHTRTQDGVIKTSIDELKAEYIWSMTATPKLPPAVSPASPAWVHFWRSQYSADYPSPIPAASHVLLLHDLCPVTSYSVARRAAGKDDIKAGKSGKVNLKEYYDSTPIHPFIGWSNAADVLKHGNKDFENTREGGLLETDKGALVASMIKDMQADIRREHTKLVPLVLQQVRLLHDRMDASTSLEAAHALLREMIHLCVRSLSWYRRRASTDSDSTNFELYPDAVSQDDLVLTRLLTAPCLTPADQLLFQDIVSEVRQKGGTSTVVLDGKTEMTLWAVVLQLTIRLHDPTQQQLALRGSFTVFPSHLPALSKSQSADVRKRAETINAHLLQLEERANHDARRDSARMMLNGILEEDFPQSKAVATAEAWQWLTDAIHDPIRVAALQRKFCDEEVVELPALAQEWCDNLQAAFNTVCKPLLQLVARRGTARTDDVDTHASSCATCAACTNKHEFIKELADPHHSEWTIKQLARRSKKHAADQSNLQYCRLHVMSNRLKELRDGMQITVPKLLRVFKLVRPADEFHDQFGTTMGENLAFLVIDGLAMIVKSELQIVHARAVHRESVLRVGRSSDLHSLKDISAATRKTIDKLNELLCQYEQAAQYRVQEVDAICGICLDTLWTRTDNEKPTDSDRMPTKAQHVSPDNAAATAAVAVPAAVQPFDVVPMDVGDADDAVEDVLWDAALDHAAEVMDALRSIVAKKQKGATTKVSQSAHFAGRLVELNCSCKFMAHLGCVTNAFCSNGKINCTTCRREDREKRFVIPGSAAASVRLGCSHAACVPFHRDRLRPVERTRRLDLLIEHVQSKPPQDKIVIFSKYVEALKMVQLMFFHCKISCLLLAGTRDKDEFRSNPSIRVLLVPLASHNAGLNLQVASHGIFLDPAPDYPMYYQAVGRLVRGGQRQPVIITHLLARDLQPEVEMYLNSTTDGNNWMERAATIESLPAVTGGMETENAAAALQFWQQEVCLDGKLMSRAAALEEAVRRSDQVQVPSDSSLMKTEHIAYVERARKRDIPLPAWKLLQQLLGAESSSSSGASSAASAPAKSADDLTDLELMHLQRSMLEGALQQAQKRAERMQITAHAMKHTEARSEMMRAWKEAEEAANHWRMITNTTQSPMKPLLHAGLPYTFELAPCAPPTSRTGLTNGSLQLCYLNSLMQALFGIADQDDGEKHSLHVLLQRAQGLTPVEANHCSVLREIGKLYQATSAAGNSAASAVRVNMQTNMSVLRFLLGRQHDPAEFLVAMKEGINEQDRGNKNIFSRVCWKTLTHGRLVTRRQCQAAAPHQFVSPEEDLFILMLPIIVAPMGPAGVPVPLSVQALAEAYQRPEDVDHRCGNGCASERSTRMHVFKELPPILLVQLERFDAYGAKITAPIGLNQGNLQLTLANGTVRRYEAVSLILHHGHTPVSGHYTTLVHRRRAPSDDAASSSSSSSSSIAPDARSHWIHYNDEKVDLVVGSTVSSVIWMEPAVLKHTYLIAYRVVASGPPGANDPADAAMQIEEEPDLPAQLPPSDDQMQDIEPEQGPNSNSRKRKADELEMKSDP
jgi:ubiquitin C-terminal hydrolase